jgi:hypothetical protein
LRSLFQFVNFAIMGSVKIEINKNKNDADREWSVRLDREVRAEKYLHEITGKFEDSYSIEHIRKAIKIAGGTDEILPETTIKDKYA